MIRSLKRKLNWGSVLCTLWDTLLHSFGCSREASQLPLSGTPCFWKLWTQFSSSETSSLRALGILFMFAFLLLWMQMLNNLLCLGGQGWSDFRNRDFHLNVIAPTLGRAFRFCIRLLCCFLQVCSQKLIFSFFPSFPHETGTKSSPCSPTVIETGGLDDKNEL